MCCGVTPNSFATTATFNASVLVSRVSMSFTVSLHFRLTIHCSQTASINSTIQLFKSFSRSSSARFGLIHAGYKFPTHSAPQNGRPQEPGEVPQIKYYLAPSVPAAHIHAKGRRSHCAELRLIDKTLPQCVLAADIHRCSAQPFCTFRQRLHCIGRRTHYRLSNSEEFGREGKSGRPSL